MTRHGRLLGLLLLTVLTMIACDQPVQQAETTGESPLGLLSGEEDLDGYARVTGPRDVDFPADHGAHPAYRHEWWYVTGNLHAEDGRRFGYQLTFFRFNLAPGMEQRPAALATNQVWMAHLALTDADGARFLHEERLARGAAGLAGAQVEPFRVWLEDWRLQGGSGEDPTPFQLRAATDDFGLSLALGAEKPLVLQGDRGYSQKGDDPGNASFYYSWTRLATRGEIRLDGEALAVTGDSWMDREWGTSTLTEEQQGWDWFSIQLDDGRDIMFYHLRLADGGIEPRSKGLLVEADGSYRLLDLDAVELQALRHWDSPEGNARYPVAWRMRIPGEQLELQLEALLDDQELRNGFRYWEGAIDVRGEVAGQAVQGHGYAELTGYVTSD
ncbi:carotenoid 1,2-hydratase [Methylonatrum kenyense]|uniref:lipocalin-like domain-containing protein n=1 Tax=Methylonatrum kenyense TaxID=455253 RepID=UPI0020BD8117|nr:lipocalin-like domain-containing protein [Methylonatrum kenyense]MCK8516325.1 carotenoid 1,2-hydratase [Methylonatrum kenyense]